MNEIMSLYPDIDPAQLPAGKTICIPDGAQCKEGLSLYTIKKGDTFFSISKRNNDVMEQIMSSNPNVDPKDMPIGTTICIPSELVPVTKKISTKKVQNQNDDVDVEDAPKRSHKRNKVRFETVEADNEQVDAVDIEN